MRSSSSCLVNSIDAAWDAKGNLWSFGVDRPGQ